MQMFISLLLVFLGFWISPSAFGALTCQNGRKVILPPTVAKASSKFEFYDSSATGTPIGTISATRIGVRFSFTNVSTIPQSIQVGIRESRLTNQISYPGGWPASPPTGNWILDGVDGYIRSLVDAAPLHSIFAPQAIVVPPGETRNISFWAKCSFVDPLNCTADSSALIGNIAGYNGSGNFTSSFEICVSEAKGAIVGSVSMELGIGANPPALGRSDESSLPVSKDLNGGLPF